MEVESHSSTVKPKRKRAVQQATSVLAYTCILYRLMKRFETSPAPACELVLPRRNACGLYDASNVWCPMFVDTLQLHLHPMLVAHASSVRLCVVMQIETHFLTLLLVKYLLMPATRATRPLCRHETQCCIDAYLRFWGCCSASTPYFSCILSSSSSLSLVLNCKFDNVRHL